MNDTGLDLSRYNGRGNWQVVKAANVKFVIIKAGGVYSDTGAPYVDKLMEDHVAGARSVGIPFGLYWYWLPFPAKNQIDFYQKILDHYAPTIQKAFIDVESNNGQSMSTITSALKQFIPAFNDMLHPVVIYTRASWWNVNVKADPAWAGYDLWAARYMTGLTNPWSDGSWKFRDWQDWKIWQHSADNNAQARKYGFPGPHPYNYSGDPLNYGDPDIDLNYFNGEDAQFRNWAGLDQEPEPEPEPTLEERVTDIERRVTELEGRC